MATKTNPNTSPRPSNPAPEPLFEAFPEPRSWALNWDGAALQGVAKPAGTPPKHNHS